MTAVRERLWKVRAEQVVLATGAHERPLVFANNDLPGVMLASAVSTYIRRYAVLPGRQAVVFTNNDSAYDAALALHQADALGYTVVDARPWPMALAERARSLGLPILAGHVVVEARRQGRAWCAACHRLDVAATSRVAPPPCLSLLAISGGSAR